MITEKSPNVKYFDTPPYLFRCLYSTATGISILQNNVDTLCLLSIYYW